MHYQTQNYNNKNILHTKTEIGKPHSKINIILLEPVVMLNVVVFHEAEALYNISNIISNILSNIIQ